MDLERHKSPPKFDGSEHEEQTYIDACYGESLRRVGIEFKWSEGSIIQRFLASKTPEGQANVRQKIARGQVILPFARL